MALLGLTLALVALVGIYASVDSVWSSGEEEITDTGDSFTECLGDVTSGSDEDCGLFEEGENDDGG